MRKPVVMMLPAIECMPFAHFYPVVLDDQIEAEGAEIEQATGEGAEQAGFWGRVLEAFATMAWPYGYATL